MMGKKTEQNQKKKPFADKRNDGSKLAFVVLGQEKQTD